MFSRKTGRHIAQVYEGSQAKQWKKEIALRIGFLNRKPFAGPVIVDLVVMMPRPQSHYGTGRNAGTLKSSAPEWHEQKPDEDNLGKAVKDAIVTSGLIPDDKHIVSSRVEKEWALAEPGVIIKIRPAK